jgi:uncharacterized Zn finger protein
MSYWGFRPYVSVARKKEKAEKKLKQLMKKNKDLKPIILHGKSIAQSWWGKAWNQNLEKYADYANRIGRGRSYVRNRAVLDLQIGPGEIKSLVQGSSSRPYSISVTIKEVNKDIWKKIKDACEGKLESLRELLDGKFPKGLSELFTAREDGLFPTPKEIVFHCSCPDWASMCKHVAATLYGVGARLDDDPSLFFTLRKVRVDDLVHEALQSKTEKLLKKASVKSSRVMDDSDLSSVFGIEMEPSAIKPKNAKGKKKPTATKKKPTATKKKAAGKKTAVRKKSTR